MRAILEVRVTFKLGRILSTFLWSFNTPVTWSSNITVVDIVNFVHSSVIYFELATALINFICFYWYLDKLCSLMVLYLCSLLFKFNLLIIHSHSAYLVAEWVVRFKCIIFMLWAFFLTEVSPILTIFIIWKKNAKCGFEPHDTLMLTFALTQAEVKFFVVCAIII